MVEKERLFQFPVGVSDYRRLVTGGYLYVDKSLAILDVLNEGIVSVIRRPRRFGKTLFMSMLQLYSNRESGYGRYDIAMIPVDKDKMGLVIEFKSIADHQNLQRGAETALEQIKTRLYATEFAHSGVKKILQIGMAFSGKQVTLAHEISST